MGEEELKIYSLINNVEALERKEELWNDHKDLDFMF